MSYNAKKLMQNATKNIGRDSLRLRKYNLQAHDLLPKPKPVFTRKE